jgi:hypothetical protein
MRPLAIAWTAALLLSAPTLPAFDGWTIEGPGRAVGRSAASASAPAGWGIAY